MTEKIKYLIVKIKPELHEKLKKASKDKGETMSTLVRGYIGKGLDSECKGSV